ncbi:hypothetical protein QYE76_038393 [Lolium multiflorum]|uniref:EDR1/CTR1/ARMC3-like peptidase-like domain-containing protein n=1 Tax=Lolium multiflorum TaxID=4521 RepID=A0AAD8T805_LOLMU|nr:hypothetical protein QYE76_038393 [Lolium multiflorum]
MERAAAASFLRDGRMPPRSTPQPPPAEPALEREGRTRARRKSPPTRRLRGDLLHHGVCLLHHGVCLLHHGVCLLHHSVCNQGGPAAAPGDRTTMKALAARYWNHNVVGYDEKLSDGFYEVCGAPMDLDIPYVAILVNRERDPVLKRLEGRAVVIAAQTRAQRSGLASVELVQKNAGLVVDAMGGVVEDATPASPTSLPISLQLWYWS